jgi:hypothetical protein
MSITSLIFIREATYFSHRSRDKMNSIQFVAPKKRLNSASTTALPLAAHFLHVNGATRKPVGVSPIRWPGALPSLASLRIMAPANSIRRRIE